MKSRHVTSHCDKPTPRAGQHGFTLLEIVIAIVIVGVLTAVALPSFQGSIRKSRRAEAFAAISAVQQAQERFRSSNANYGNLNSPADAATLPNLLTTTPSGYYVITVSSETATGYTAKATAQGAQAADAGCRMMGVRLANGSLSYGSGASALDWSDPARCWAR